MALFRSLAYRSFALLWSGQTISRLGDSLYQIGLAWWVLEKTGSAAAMGTVFIFSFTPMLLFLLVGGVVVDRFPRLRVMFISDLLRGTLVLAVTLLVVSDRLEIWHVYAFSTTFGLVAAFFQPAYAAIMPELLPREALASANSLTSLSGQAISIIGPALGAALIKLGGTAAAFALDGLTFFISAVCLVLIPPRPMPRQADKPPANIMREVREGISTVTGTPWLRLWIGISTLLNITWAAPFIVALPFVVTKNLGADVGGLGLVYSLSSLGAVLGTIGVGQTARYQRRGLLVCSSWIVAGVTVAALGWPISLLWIGICGLIASAAGAVNNVTGSVIAQEYIPPELLGRVASIGTLGSQALLPVGLGIVGWATDLAGALLVFAVGGALTAALGILGIAHPAMRNLK
jgi:hypothetical protein